MATKEHFQAASHGNADFLVTAIANGISVNSVNDHGRTLFHFAALGDHHELIQILVALGGNPRVQDLYGNAPMHWAALNHNFAAIKALQRAGGVCDVANRNGYTPLHSVVYGFGYAPLRNVAIGYPSRVTTALASLAAIVECTDIKFAAKSKSGHTAAEMARQYHNRAFAAVIDAVCVIRCALWLSFWYLIPRAVPRDCVTGPGCVSLVTPPVCVAKWDHGGGSTRHGSTTDSKAPSRVMWYSLCLVVTIQTPNEYRRTLPGC